MQLPTKPTSDSWIEDASALLEMGAKTVDAGTVKGLLSRIYALELERVALRQALEFYADGRNYKEEITYTSDMSVTSVSMDEGCCARKVLSQNGRLYEKVCVDLPFKNVMLY